MNFTQKPFFKKTLACIIAAVIGAIVLLRISIKYLHHVPVIALVGVAPIYLLACIASIFIWQYKVPSGAANVVNIPSFWEGVIRYFIALDMFAFGMGKIFHLQFRVPLGLFDNPFSDLDSQTLLWAFFGKFYAYTVIIAALQISAALLLSFRRTRLLGVFFLLPILLNIILLNYFYDFGLVVSVYTILLTLATIYLLLLDYPRLVQVFFGASNSFPVYQFKAAWIKKGLRLSIIFIPVSLIFFNKSQLFYPEYTGKYLVKSVTINNVIQPLPQSSRDSVLTKVFIDHGDNDFVLEYNDYRRRLIGSYTYNDAKHQFKVTWRYPTNLHDTLTAIIMPGKKPDQKVISGHMGRASFSLEMVKASY